MSGSGPDRARSPGPRPFPSGAACRTWCCPAAGLRHAPRRLKIFFPLARARVKHPGRRTSMPMPGIGSLGELNGIAPTMRGVLPPVALRVLTAKNLFSMVCFRGSKVAFGCRLAPWGAGRLIRTWSRVSVSPWPEKVSRAGYQINFFRFFAIFSGNVPPNLRNATTRELLPIRSRNGHLPKSRPPYGCPFRRHFHQPKLR